MKRDGLLRHLRRYGCVLRREGKEQTLWENRKRVMPKQSPGI